MYNICAYTDICTIGTFKCIIYENMFIKYITYFRKCGICIHKREEVGQRGKKRDISSFSKSAVSEGQRTVPVEDRGPGGQAPWRTRIQAGRRRGGPGARRADAVEDRGQAGRRRAATWRG